MIPFSLQFIRDNLHNGIIAGIGLLIGFFTDIGKERWKDRRRAREDHAQIIVNDILSPVFDYLKDFYLPICGLKKSPLGVGHMVISQKPSDISSDSYVRSEHRLEILNPPGVKKGGHKQPACWNEAEAFQRYYDDAVKHHYPSLLSRWESFRKSFEEIASDCLGRSEHTTHELRTSIGMPPAYAGGQQTSTWVNYERIALFVFLRQFGVSDERLYLPDRARNVVHVSGDNQQVVQTSSLEESNRVMSLVNKMAQEEHGTSALKDRLNTLLIEGEALIKDFRLALSKPPVTTRCPLA